MSGPWSKDQLGLPKKMNHFKLNLILGLVLHLFGITDQCSLAQPPQLRAHAIKVGSLFVNNRPAGSCFYVDPRGYIATSFWNVCEADDAAVLFNNGSRFKVTGVIAASKGKDIAILKIVAKTKNDSLSNDALTLDTEADPKIDDGTFPWGGPNSLPATGNVSLPKVKRRLLGEEYLLGLPRAPSSDIGCDPDTRWIWLSLFRHLSCNGGPVFDRNGKVVAMLSAALDPGSKVITDPTANVYSAVHIQHVSNLIPADDVKPKSLKSLQDWVDPIPSIDAIKPVQKPTLEEEQSLGSALRRDLSIPGRLADLQRRITQVEQENAEAGKLLVRRQSNNLELLAKIEKVENQLASIRPEESYQETYTETVYETETKTERERGPDGKYRDVKTRVRVPREVTKKRTKYRFSSSQIAFMGSLRMQISELQINVQDNRNEFAFDTNVRVPFVTQIQRHLEDECFFLADPLGLQGKPAQQSLEAELTRTIDEGGAGGIIYLARAMTRIAQSDLGGAEFDLKETSEVDTKYRMLVQGLEARIHFLKGEKASGARILKDLTTDFESDARVWMMAARIDMDSKNYSAAVRHLEQAAKLAPHEIEIKHGLAWMLLSVPSVNAKRATNAATDVVRMTAGRDWSALASLSAAYSHSQKSELAIDALETAIRIAPPSALETCEKWRSKLNMQQTIVPEW